MNRMMRINLACILAVMIVAGCGDNGAADSEGDPAGDAAAPTTTSSAPATNGDSRNVDQKPIVTPPISNASSKPTTTRPVVRSSQSGGSNPELDRLVQTATKRPAPRLVGTQQKKVNYRDGKIKVRKTVRQFSDDSELNHGPYEEYWPSGELFKKGEFEEGVPVGEWTICHDNGEICRRPTYNKGQLEGTFEVFRADKTKRAKSSYRRGLKHGEWQIFNDAGDTAIVIANYRNDMLHGKRSEFFPGGEPKTEIHFKDNVRDGTMTVWYKDGSKAQEATFRNGERHGKLTIWNEDGTTRLETEYQDGVPVEDGSDDTETDGSTIDISE